MCVKKNYSKQYIYDKIYNIYNVENVCRMSTRARREEYSTSNVVRVLHPTTRPLSPNNIPTNIDNNLGESSVVVARCISRNETFSISCIMLVLCVPFISFGVVVIVSIYFVCAHIFRGMCFCIYIYILVHMWLWVMVMYYFRKCILCCM